MRQSNVNGQTVNTVLGWSRQCKGSSRKGLQIRDLLKCKPRRGLTSRGEGERSRKIFVSVYPRGIRLNVSSEDILTLAGLWTQYLSKSIWHLSECSESVTVFQQMGISNLILSGSKHSSWHPPINLKWQFCLERSCCF